MVSEAISEGAIWTQNQVHGQNLVFNQLLASHSQCDFATGVGVVRVTMSKTD